jgi:hypothetical protein
MHDDDKPAKKPRKTPAKKGTAKASAQVGKPAKKEKTRKTKSPKVQRTSMSIDLSYVPEPREKMDVNTNWLRAVREPTDPRLVPISWLFTAREFSLMRVGFLPCVMEEKWFIYLRRNRLFLMRSWTMAVAYVVEFVPRSPRPGTVLARRLLVSQDPEYFEPLTDTQAALQCQMVISAVLFGQLFFPAGAGLDANPMMSWSLLGSALTRGHDWDAE